jgi:hypothetical protein
MYDLKEIMNMISIPERTIRRHLKEGLLLGTKVGGVWKFSDEDVVNYLGTSKVSKLINDTALKELIDYYNGFISDQSEVIYMAYVEFRSNDDKNQFLRVLDRTKHKCSLVGTGSPKGFRYVFKGQPSDVAVLMDWIEEFNNR